MQKILSSLLCLKYISSSKGLEFQYGPPCWFLDLLHLSFSTGPLRVSCGRRGNHGPWDGTQLRDDPRQRRLLPGKRWRRRLHHGGCYRVQLTGHPNQMKISETASLTWFFFFFVLLSSPVTLFHGCLTTVTWRSCRATWALEVGSVSSICQTPERCTEGSAVAMATWKKERNVTAETKRSLLWHSVRVFPCTLPRLDACVLICSQPLLQECTSPCCNANNCTLRAGAECAHGVCCHDCKVQINWGQEIAWIMCPVDHSAFKMCLKFFIVEVMMLFILWCQVFLFFLREFSTVHLSLSLSLSVQLKSPGVLCRAPSGSCDLPEYCDGRRESCPANFYLVDGTSCAGGQAYCYTGMCLTVEQQCRSLWGQGEWAWRPVICFFKIEYGLTFDDMVCVIL